MNFIATVYFYDIFCLSFVFVFFYVTFVHTFSVKNELW